MKTLKELFKTKKYIRLDNLCKMLKYRICFDAYNRITIYDDMLRLKIAYTDVNEALNCVRALNKIVY